MTWTHNKWFIPIIPDSDETINQLVWWQKSNQVKKLCNLSINFFLKCHGLYYYMLFAVTVICSSLYVVLFFLNCVWADLRSGEDGPSSYFPTEQFTCRPFTVRGKSERWVSVSLWDVLTETLAAVICFIISAESLKPHQTGKGSLHEDHMTQRIHRNHGVAVCLSVCLFEGADVITLVDVRGNERRVLRRGDKKLFSVQRTPSSDSRSNWSSREPEERAGPARSAPRWRTNLTHLNLTLPWQHRLN